MRKNLEKQLWSLSILVLFALSGWVMWEVIPPVPAPIVGKPLSAARWEELLNQPEPELAPSPVLGQPAEPRTAVHLDEVTGMTTITFTSGSGTWTVPGGVNSIQLLCVGGGGSGEAAGGGNGGGGGGVISRASYSVTPGVGISYAVGTGGTSGNGGNTTFDGLTAGGGQAGNGSGGTGGTGDYAGGNGASQSAGIPGGGGSSAGRSANGANGAVSAGGTAPSEGGNGGAGGDPPVDGSFPGGGGGGSGGMTMGGAGGGGYIEITYLVADDAVGSSSNPGFNWWRYIHPRMRLPEEIRTWWSRRPRRAREAAVAQLQGSRR